MRILLVCYDSPLERFYGAGLRTHNIWEALKRVGDVSTLVMEPSERTEPDTTPRTGEIGRIRFKKPWVPWVTPETRKIRGLIGELTDKRAFNIVVVRYLRLAMLVRGSINAPMIVDGDDLDKRTPTFGRSHTQRLLDAAKATARRAITRHALRAYAHVWFVNPLDMIKFPVRSGSILTNLANVPATLLPKTPVSPPCVLMVGKFGYAPNAEAAEFFISQVLPTLRRALPGSWLRLVGQCPPETAKRWRAVDGVEVAGFIDDLAAEYARATVVVAPVFSGGGTQIKVIEALGYACGTVASEFAASGFAPNLRDGQHLLVARNPHEWITQTLRLLRDPIETARLGQAGRQVIMQVYSFDQMAREVDSTIKRIIPRGVG